MLNAYSDGEQWYRILPPWGIENTLIMQIANESKQL
jgi:hypothetical protein